MSDLEARILTLEARLGALEDERAIGALVASYGPLVDAGAADDVADLWTRDGVYDVDELVMTGHDELAAMVRSRHHRQWIESGCAHFLGPVHVTLHGDAAVAVCHSLMVVRSDGQFVVRRATANHWELTRAQEGWRAVRRTSRVLDGRPEALDLLVAGVRGEPAP